jgi:RNA polymerase-binding protein DksA
MVRSTARKLAGSTAAAAKRVTRKAVASTPATRKTAAKKTPATKKTVAKKTPATKKTVAKKTPATKKTAAKKTPATKKTAAKKTPATKKTAAKKTPATKKTVAKKAATAKKTVTQKAVTKQPPAAKRTAKQTARQTAKQARSRPAAPRRLAVKADEKPWTKSELAEVRGDLNTDRERLRSELNLAEHELHDLMRDAGDGAGNDQADVGSTTFERDHEMSLANNAREMLAQTERALARIDDGSYGVCESCGEPIGKMRLMAFPRATLCLSCKQREERR